MNDREEEAPSSRGGIATVALVVLLLVWFATASSTGGVCPEAFSAGFGNVFLAITVTCALVVGLAGGGVRTRRRIARSLAAGCALVGWSIVLLARTPYLEPLPGSAGQLATWLLVLAALGAGLIAGFHWWAVVALPAGAVGFFHLSESLLDDGVECGPYHPSVTRGMFLVPIALAAGVVIARFVPRHARLVGVVVLVAPLAAVGWAGLRHARPVDRQPAVIYPIELRALPGPLSYRGLAIGDSKARMLHLLGPPDRVSTSYDVTGSIEFVDYTYGADTVTYIFRTGASTRREVVDEMVVRDSRSQTDDGVGIGDSLEVARRRYPTASCFLPLHRFDPICTLRDEAVIFENDPIDRIVLS